MTFAESGRGEQWAMYVTGRTTSTPTGSMQSPVRVAAGTTNSPDSRIGDYSGTTVDPSDGLTFWSANEYQGADFWDTHVASFTVAGTAIASTPPGIGSALVNPNAGPANLGGAAASRVGDSSVSTQKTVQTGSAIVAQKIDAVRIPTRDAIDRFWAEVAGRDLLQAPL